jgi:hypothetical protein
VSTSNGIAERAAGVGSAVTRLAGNDYAQERLGDAARELTGAYKRASGRRAAKAAQDRKIHRRVRRGAESLGEAVRALAADRRRPPRRRWPRVAIVAVVLGAGAAAADSRVRNRVLALAGGAQGEES